MGQYNEFLTAAQTLALEAGAIIKEAINLPKCVESKGFAIDLVTETDKKCEAIVKQRLASLYPEHKFIGEETSDGVYELGDEPTWIVDPVDGTTNFVHAWPEVCVSIALVIGRKPVVGVLYNPCHDEMYTAVKGSGSFLNGRPLKVSDNQTIDKAIIITEYGYNRTEAVIQRTLRNLETLMRMNMRAMRMTGSGALDLCYIARGIADGIYAWGWKPWDYAAAQLVLEEAGGAIYDPSGGEFSILGGGIIAGNPPIAAQLVKIITSDL